MASTTGKIKLTAEITGEAKHRLAMLKADLRLRLPQMPRGSISEASIIEELIQAADMGMLVAAHSKALSTASDRRSRRQNDTGTP